VERALVRLPRLLDQDVEQEQPFLVPLLLPAPEAWRLVCFPAPAPMGETSAGMVDQNVAHRSARSSEQVTPVPRSAFAAQEDPPDGLVDERCGFERVAGPLASQKPCRDSPESGIDQR
jgi:hypothetical protein